MTVSDSSGRFCLDFVPSDSASILESFIEVLLTLFHPFTGIPRRTTTRSRKINGGNIEREEGTFDGSSSILSC